MFYYLRLFLVIVSVILMTLNNSQAGTRDPNTADSTHIEYGNDFKYVGRLCGEDKDKLRFCGSAVAIDHHYIITAAHVVKDSVICKFTIEDEDFLISKIYMHKDFETSFGIADIAVGYSEKSFGLNFYPPLYDKDDEVDKLCCISGYGLTGTFLTGAIYSDDKKRGGSNYIDFITKDLLICSVTPTEKRKTSLEFLIASGDSGGGLFIDGKLAGINSCIMSENRSPKSKYNEESGHTRVSKFVNWINQIRNK